MQLSLFSDSELLGQSEAYELAKLYTASQIKECTGNQLLIAAQLEQGNKKEAYKLFDESFRCFGFGGGEYRFCASYQGSAGKIHIKGHGTIEVTSRELFKLIL